MNFEEVESLVKTGKWNSDYFTTIFYRKLQINYIKNASIRAPKTTQENSDKITTLIKEKPTITRKELAEKMNLSEDGVKYHLNKLKKDKKIKHIGSTKKGVWEVIK